MGVETVTSTAKLYCSTCAKNIKIVTLAQVQLLTENETVRIEYSAQNGYERTNRTE